MRQFAEADLGFVRHDGRIFAVKVCAWHHDADRATREAIADGFAVTHGICDLCAAKLIAQRAGERFEESLLPTAQLSPDPEELAVLEYQAGL